MDKMKMRLKSTSKDSSKSARTTKTATVRTSAHATARTSAKTSKSIVKNFMKGLMTTEELMKKNKTTGLANIRIVLSPADMKNMKPEKLINTEFNAAVKGLKNTNNKPFGF